MIPLICVTSLIQDAIKIYIYIYKDIYIHIYIHIYIYIHTQTHTDRRTDRHARMHARTHAPTHTLILVLGTLWGPTDLWVPSYFFLYTFGIDNVWYLLTKAVYPRCKYYNVLQCLFFKFVGSILFVCLVTCRAQS